MRLIALLVLFPATALGQLEGPDDDLVAKVRDVAALSVRNSDAIEELRGRVGTIAGDVRSLADRVTQLELSMFPSTPVPVETKVFSPPVAIEYVSPQWQPAISQPTTTTRTRTIERRQYRTPVRSFLGRLLRRNVTSSVNRSVGSNWSFPGDITSHLSGPPHYVSSSYLSGLTYSQQISLHNRLHGG